MGIVCGDPDVARRRHFEARTQGVALKPVDHRHGTVADRLTELVDHGDEAPAIFGMLHRRHVVDVGAANEGPAASAREHHAAQVVLAGKAEEGLGEIEQRRRVEHVKPAGIIEHDMSHHTGGTAVPGDVDLWTLATMTFRSVALCAFDYFYYDSTDARFHRPRALLRLRAT